MSAVELERALGDPDTPLGDLLDLADDAIERAGRDGEALDRLAARLERAAARRGPGATPLRIAAARARATRDVAAAPPPPAAGTEAGEVAQVAGLAPRGLALLLDVVVVLAGLALADAAGISGWVALAVAFAYFSLPRALGSNTAGKALVGLEILRADGSEQVGLVRMVVRTLAHWGLWLTVVGGLVDLLVAALDDHRRSLHDAIAGTVVVLRAPPRREG